MTMMSLINRSLQLEKDWKRVCVCERQVGGVMGWDG